MLLRVRGTFSKKTKFFADIGIFLIFFAIISSAISVYFESKIDDIEDAINEEKAKEFIFRDLLNGPEHIKEAIRVLKEIQNQ